MKRLGYSWYWLRPAYSRFLVPAGYNTQKGAAIGGAAGALIGRQSGTTRQYPDWCGGWCVGWCHHR